MKNKLSVTDHDAATYMSLEGFEVRDIDSTSERWKFYFDKSAEQAMKDFYQGNDNKYRPSEFCERRVQLKKLVRQS